MDKNGRLVTKHVNGSKDTNDAGKKRAGLLSRLFPSKAANSSSTEQRAVLNDLIEKGYQDVCESTDEVFQQIYGEGHGDRDTVRRMREENLKEAAVQKAEILKNAKSYSDDTIKIINDSVVTNDFSANYLYVELRRKNASHTETREYFAYAGALHKARVPVLMDHVRIALKTNDTSSLPDHEAVSAVYAVAIAARRQRFERQLSEDSHDSFERFETNGSVSGLRPQMTPGLAQVILDHHDRASEISQYLDQRNRSDVEAVDIDSLKEYLSAPARSLTEGML